MTLARQDKYWSVICDECGQRQELVGELFVNVQAELIADDWQQIRSGADWEHLCTDCRDPRG